MTSVGKRPGGPDTPQHPTNAWVGAQLPYPDQQIRLAGGESLPSRPCRPRIHDGALSAMDLTARHPRTGELLSTVQFMVQTSPLS